MDERLSSDIKIFVTAHKPVSLFRSNIFQPVQVGSKINRLPGFSRMTTETILRA